MKKNIVTVNRMIIRKGIICLAICLGIGSFYSCNDDYDDTELRENIQDLEDRVTSLEEWQQTINTDIQSLQTLVSALENRDYITNVSPLVENGVETGYVISFQNNTPITIRHGQDGADGQNGTNGQNGTTPVIGAAQGNDGIYYWTINGSFLTDANGNPLPVTGPKGDKGDTGTPGANGQDGADGQDGTDGQDGADGQDGTDGLNGKDAIAPQVRINAATNEWEISTDKGLTWTSTGVKATGEKGDKGETGDKGEKGDAVFSRIDVSDPNHVTFYLIGGESFTLPRSAAKLTLVADAGRANTFTITSNLLEDGTGNVVDIRVESENADGTAILTRANEQRWTVEYNINSNELTIVAKPAACVAWEETALLKVNICSKDGTPLAYGQTVFKNQIAAVTDVTELAHALADENQTYVALQSDLSLSTSLTISSDKTIDLNGKTLSNTNAQSRINVNKGTVTFTNGTIAFPDEDVQGDIVIGVDKNTTGGDGSVVSTANAIFENVKFTGTIFVSYGSSTEIKDSEITALYYAVGTNAGKSTAQTQPISITLTNTKLTAETPVFVNIPSEVNIDGCTINGGWQGIMVRGGTAHISNSTITLDEKCTPDIQDKNQFTSSAWQSGNQVPVAGITMGNNTTSAYQYPTKVTLKNTSVSGYEGYWAVYAEATSVCTVDFSYDNDCTFSPSLDPSKSFQQGLNPNQGYITVTNSSTGTATKY